MAENIVLYVRSVKVGQATYTVPDFGHYCSAGYRSTREDLVLCEDDRKAVELIRNAGLDFDLVDLGSASAGDRLNARLEGVKVTPTLFYKGQKLEGLHQIISTLQAIVNTE